MLKLNWLTKLFIHISPQSFLRHAARQQGVDDRKIDYSFKLFGDAERIDIQPLTGEHRGFIICLDCKLTLWFFQDGDHFFYDGFEVGEYDKGEVMVFDKLKL